jgi:hypothetical protein
LHEKQSSVAPVAGALLLRFLGAAVAEVVVLLTVAAAVVLVVVVDVPWALSASTGWVMVVVGETAMMDERKREREREDEIERGRVLVIAVHCYVASAGCGACIVRYVWKQNRQDSEGRRQCSMEHRRSASRWVSIILASTRPG